MSAKPIVKRARGERYDQKYVLNHANLTQVSCNTWGFIIYIVGVKVFMVSKKMAAEEYAQCLRNNLFNGSIDMTNKIFMQDNCSFHATAIAFTTIKDSIDKCIKHPPQSCDLNPIENVWHLIQRKLNLYLRSNYLNTESELFEKVREFAEEIPIVLINNLIDSMPNRIRDVQMNNRGSTRY